MASQKRDLVKKLKRIVNILNIISERKSVTTASLAAEFNVTYRTIQRDLRLLSEVFQIQSSPKGTYSFAEGFSLKMMRLTTEEASLLTFLYEITQSMGGNFRQSFNTILKKSLAEEYETPFYCKIPEGDNLKDFACVKEIEEAIDNTQKIIVHYKSTEKKRDYQVRPLKIIYYDGFWYLLAQVDGKKGIIKFRLEHIEGVELLDETFVEPSNLKTILEQSTNVWFSEKRGKKVVLKIDKEAAKFFKQRKYFPVQKIKKENRDGSIVIGSNVSDYMEVIPTILYWMPHILVIEPRELKVRIKRTTMDYLIAIKKSGEYNA